MKIILTAALAVGLFGAEFPVSTVGRTVQVGPLDITPIYCKLRYTTIIMLPPDEVVLEAVAGDLRTWEVSGREGTNLVSVKPSAAGALSNLNVYTESGKIYPFTLQEGGAPADLKVIVEATKELKTGGPARWVPVDRVRIHEERATAAEQKAKLIAEQSQKEIEKAKASAELAVRRAEVEVPKSFKFPYVFESGKAPFNLRSIWHNDKATYIDAEPWESFVVYEKDDGKDKIVDFYPDGPTRWVVSKVVRHGVIKINQKQTEFVERK